MKALFIAALCLPLAACDLAVLTGEKTEFQKHQERMVAATAIAIEAKPVAQVQPTITPASLAAPVALIATQPQCHEVFRITRCLNGQAVEWFYGDAP